MDAIRSDIREDRDGQLLRVGMRVLDKECAPIRDAVVEVWHCDAVGTYSGFEAASDGRGSAGDVDATRYFPEDVTTAVYRREPYASDAGRDTFNRDDTIFDDALILATTKEADGYLGLVTFTLA